VANGTLSAPAINFASSTNTGIYSPATGQIALAEGGQLFLHNIGFENTALGVFALQSNVGLDNTAIGYEALYNNGTGSSNTAVGNTALYYNTTGAANTALGEGALLHTTGGFNNIAIGFDAGLNPTATSNSIFIGNAGDTGDNATIRIGTQDTQASAFIAGIRGVTTGANNAVPVMIDSNGQLGTVSSSRRYKEDIQPMPDMTAALLKLRPVTFRYKKPYDDGSKPIQYGLIAEEVAEAMPALAVFNNDGQPETVKYQLLPVLLLNEVQRQQKTIAAQAEQMAALARHLASLETRLARRDRLAARRHHKAHHTHFATAEPPRRN
jgi:hypothetical protein